MFCVPAGEVVDLVVKHECATPAPANGEATESQKNNDSAHHRWVTLTDVISLPDVVHIDTGGALHMFALRLENLLLGRCMAQQANVHMRLHIYVICKKTRKLQAPGQDDKLFFAGKFSFGKKTQGPMPLSLLILNLLGDPCLSALMT